eukprot:29434_1
MANSTKRGKSSKMEMSDSDEDIDLTTPSTTTKQNSISDKKRSSNNKNAPKSTYNAANKMWVEKYRPSELKTIISHTSIINTISKLVSARKLPHLLLYGPPGTGKTTTILASARELNGKAWKSMTLELNASDERGINIIRDRIKTFASTKQIFSNGFKLIILDEADAMTSSAQFALRRVIEKYTKNTRFCLICNYVNKIIPALQSRCTKFRFAPLKDNDITGRLRHIADEESVELTEDGMKSILRLSNGDMRRCLNILQSAHTSHATVDEKAVYETTGCPKPKQIEHITNCLLNQDFAGSFKEIYELMIENGLALTDIITGIYQLVIRMKLDSVILCQILSELADLEHRLTVATNEKLQLASLVALFQKVRLRAFQKHSQKKQ